MTKTTLILILLFSSLSSIANKYTMKDLEVLHGQNNFKEFLEHAHDIRPSLRDKKWEKMFSKMAINFILDKIEKEHINEKTYKEIEKLSSRPVLKKDVFFQERRERYSLLYFQQCLRSNNASCEKDIKQFWNNSKKSPELSYSMAKILLGLNESKSVWTYLNKVTHSNVSEYYCNKDFLKEQFIKEIYLYLPKDPTRAQISNATNELVNENCWNQLSKSIAPLVLSKDKIISKKAYEILQSKGALEQSTRDLYLFKYILDGPVIGDTFNEAWTMVDQIGRDHKRRMNLFSEIKKMDPLPGKVFQTPNREKLDTILLHLTVNFPEYTDYYARTCLNYLKGVGSFPTGNPTMECRDLMDISKGKKWVEQNIQIEYSAIKKF